MLTAIKNVVTYTVLLLWFVAVVMPLIWVVTNSFRSSQEIFKNPFGAPWLITGSPYADDSSIPTPWQGVKNNYQSAWVKSHFSSFFVNSVLVTTASLIGVLTFSAMAAYALARFEFRGNRTLFL
jgi:N-acetylglucosamine transport system permease protein